MKICLVYQEYCSPHIGGIAVITRSLAQGLTDRGHKVTILCQGKTETRTVQKGKIQIVQLGNEDSFWRWLTGYKGQIDRLIFSLRIWLFLRQKPGYDLVEFPNWGGGGFAYSLFNQGRYVIRLYTPWVKELGYHHKGIEGWRLKLGDWLERFSVQRAGKVIASSRFIAQEADYCYRLSPDKLCLIYHGVELKKVVHRTQRGGQVKILYVGRLEPRKGFQDLTRALLQTIEVVGDRVHFICAGQDTVMSEYPEGYYQYCLKQIPVNYHQYLTRYDQVTDKCLQALYRQSDIVVFPSLYESFGLVPLEAMSYAKPVVATRVGVMEELIQDGENSLLIEPGDPTELARAIVCLVRDKPLRKRLGDHARETVERKYSLEEMVTKTLHVYDGFQERFEVADAPSIA